MKPYLISLLILFLGNSLTAQVFADAYLQATHQGTLATSTNYPNESLKYVFEYIANESAIKKRYQLQLRHGNQLLNSYDVQVRNLIVTCYFEIKLTNTKGVTKTLTAVYDKGNKWLRVKFAPQEDCAKAEQKWERLNHIKAFDEILQHVVYQMDKNLVLECYGK